MFLCYVFFSLKLLIHLFVVVFVLKEQPSSAANLRFVLEWTWNKVISTKDEFDQTCE